MSVFTRLSTFSRMISQLGFTVYQHYRHFRYELICIIPKTPSHIYSLTIFWVDSHQTFQNFSEFRLSRLISGVLVRLIGSTNNWSVYKANNFLYHYRWSALNLESRLASFIKNLKQ